MKSNKIFKYFSDFKEFLEISDKTHFDSNLNKRFVLGTLEKSPESCRISTNTQILYFSSNFYGNILTSNGFLPSDQPRRQSFEDLDLLKFSTVAIV